MSAPIDLEAFAAAVPEGLVATLRGAACVLSVSHENPDADTLGAALAMRRVIAEIGGQAQTVCTDTPPELYDFLPGIDSVRTDPEPGAGYDLVLLVDCATTDRVGA